MIWLQRIGRRTANKLTILCVCFLAFDGCSVVLNFRIRRDDAFQIGRDAAFLIHLCFFLRVFTIFTM